MLVRMPFLTEGMRRVSREPLFLRKGFHLMSHTGVSLCRFLSGFLPPEDCERLLGELPEDGIYGKHRDYREVLDWSGRSKDLQKAMIEALSGVLSRLLSRFEEYYPVE